MLVLFQIKRSLWDLKNPQLTFQILRMRVIIKAPITAIHIYPYMVWSEPTTTVMNEPTSPEVGPPQLPDSPPPTQVGPPQLPDSPPPQEPPAPETFFDPWRDLSYEQLVAYGYINPNP